MTSLRGTSIRCRLRYPSGQAKSRESVHKRKKKKKLNKSKQVCKITLEAHYRCISILIMIG